MVLIHLIQYFKIHIQAFPAFHFYGNTGCLDTHLLNLSIVLDTSKSNGVLGHLIRLQG